MGITAVKAAAGSVIRHIFLDQYQCQGNGTRGRICCTYKAKTPGGVLRFCMWLEVPTAPVGRWDVSKKPVIKFNNFHKISISRCIDFIWMVLWFLSILRCFLLPCSRIAVNHTWRIAAYWPVPVHHLKPLAIAGVSHKRSSNLLNPTSLLVFQ